MTTLRDLNEERKDELRKSSREEHFLEEFNQSLVEFEESQPNNQASEKPVFVFVFGLPRSGTTLLSQVLAYGGLLGYINNFVARFWRAPLVGINLYRSIYRNPPKPDFRSTFGSTDEVHGIHEFGYFWRYWLQKEELTSVSQFKEAEATINWEGLKAKLNSLQAELGAPFICKNIFGAYHFEKLQALLENVLFVHIERDELDVACSILDARKKFYHDLNSWWSYAPPNVGELLKLDYWDQIAGQVHYLKEFYEEKMANLEEEKVIRVDYQHLTEHPRQILEIVGSKMSSLYQVEMPIDLANAKFDFRQYSDLTTKRKFEKSLANLR